MHSTEFLPSLRSQTFGVLLEHSEQQQKGNMRGIGNKDCWRKMRRLEIKEAKARH